jgi:hypothetical protein
MVSEGSLLWGNGMVKYMEDGSHLLVVITKAAPRRIDVDVWVIGFPMMNFQNRMKWYCLMERNIVDVVYFGQNHCNLSRKMK